MLGFLKSASTDAVLPKPVNPPDIPLRHQAVRPLCALMTIFVVVIVFGIVVGFAQSNLLSRTVHASEGSEAEPTAQLVSEVVQPAS